MPNSRIRISLFVALLCAPLAADTYPRQPEIDIQHYRFELEVSDDHDRIDGRATVEVRVDDPAAGRLALDLIGPDSAPAGRGMTVESARWLGAHRPSEFTHARGRLTVPLPTDIEPGSRRSLVITYGGVPAGGLIIGDNKHGARCFFSNNWPDKARHWLPMLDHPYDKATADIVITAPSHYQAVANGLLVEETDLGDGRRLTHWRQSVPISSWLYAVGIARFAVEHREPFAGIPIQTWVFATDREAGFHDFAEPTRHVLEFFTDYIGPYPYQKLANVQTTSVGGGMESATVLFYDDDSVTGDRNPRWQGVIVHEIAHQWWGNSVTEADWDDVWLSEGFATYFTLLFVEHAEGRDAFVEGLKRSRDSVFDFQDKNPEYRLVHANLDDMRHVLTQQIYQKGAWVLHMLRGVLGDAAFRQGIRRYYRDHRDGSASTADLRRVMEEVSGRDLGWFFQQWLYRGGSLDLTGSWSWSDGWLTLDLRQTDAAAPFRMPLTVELSSPDGATTTHVIELEGAHQRIELAAAERPAALRLDPELQVLMRAEVTARH